MSTLEKVISVLKEFSSVEGCYADEENASYMKKEEGIVNDVIDGKTDINVATETLKKEQEKTCKRIAQYIIGSKQVNLVFALKMQGFKTLHLC